MKKHKFTSVLNKSELAMYCISTLFIFLFVLFFVFYKILKFNIILSPTPCYLNKFFHIYCPGCGGTRALTELLNFNFFKSFIYNPIIIYSALIFACYYVCTTISILTKKYNFFKFHMIYIYIGIILLVVNFILKNILAIFFHIDPLGDISYYW